MLTRRSFLALMPALPLAVKAFFQPLTLSLSALKAKTVSTAVYQDITTGQAAGIVADAAGWPASPELLKGQTTLSYWWLDDADAFEASEQLQLLEASNV